MTFDSALSRLTAGLDRDEAIARAAIIPAVPRQQPELSAWEVFDTYDDDEHRSPTTYVGQWGDVHLRDTHGNEQIYDHVARQDPHATLLRVEAIRKAIEAEFGNLYEIDNEWGDGCDITDIRAGRCRDKGAWSESSVFAALAGIYTEPTEESNG